MMSLFKTLKEIENIDQGIQTLPQIVHKPICKSRKKMCLSTGNFLSEYQLYGTNGTKCDN
jgi:hypothetical protein